MRRAITSSSERDSRASSSGANAASPWPEAGTWRSSGSARRSAACGISPDSCASFGVAPSSGSACGVPSASVGALRTMPAASMTAGRSMAASRPQANAVLFMSTAAPLSSMARISASNEIGTRPCCQA